MKALLTILILSAMAFGQYVLELDGSKAQHVDHGAFWELYQPGSNVGLESDFAWEAWIKINPATELGYVLSAGYGGAHAILFGVARDPSGKYNLTGNFTVMSTGVCQTSTEWVMFGSTTSPMEADTWYHIAVASKQHWLRSYVNGQHVSSQYWAGTRISSACQSLDTAGGVLYVGGSHHLNFSGRIAAVRGWEGFSPYYEDFTPEVVFNCSRQLPDTSVRGCNFLADYTQKALMPNDLSNGYKGVKHSGKLHSAMFNLVRGNPTQSAYPLPQFVIDSTFQGFQ